MKKNFAMVISIIIAMSMTGITAFGAETTPTKKLATVESAVNNEAEATPEALPATPEGLPALPATPEELPALPTTPEALPEVPTTPEALPEVPTTPEALPEVPATPEALPEVPATPEALPAVPATPEALPIVLLDAPLLTITHRIHFENGILEFEETITDLTAGAVINVCEYAEKEDEELVASSEKETIELVAGENKVVIDYNWK